MNLDNEIISLSDAERESVWAELFQAHSSNFSVVLFLCSSVSTHPEPNTTPCKIHVYMVVLSKFLSKRKGKGSGCHISFQWSIFIQSLKSMTWLSFLDKSFTIPPKDLLHFLSYPAPHLPFWSSVKNWPSAPHDRLQQSASSSILGILQKGFGLWPHPV